MWRGGGQPGPRGADPRYQEPAPPFRRNQEMQLDPQREKAMRSIFVANIAFETTEDQLRSVLTEVGPVVSLKMIQDPVTGKPRGFGFCEFEDAETAMSACRNLAGRELNGRPLRIDSAMNAPGENFRGSAQLGPRGPIEPPLHGKPVSPEAAPEAITKAVASLPPEQMFELMKQMKWCIQHNPQEARQLLLHNPQLSYALLQAQVMMRIVDLETAQNLLHRTQRGPAILSQAPPPPPPPPSSANNQPPPLSGHPPREPHHHRHVPGPEPRYSSSRDWYEDRPPGPPHRGRDGPPPPPPPPQRMHRSGPPQLPVDHPQHHHHYEQSGGMSPQDQEKAALIMQVLSLSDEQIQHLPPDQRSSILKLKEQIARNS